MKRLVHLSIKGRVQGVGYRAFVELEAELRGLEGWVRNRRDGTVEAVVQGEADIVQSLIETCHEGPPASHVTAVNISDADPEALNLRSAGEKFAVLPTA
jgi:acylphosphatase